MLNAEKVASYFIEQSSSLPENDLTNLKLQKILFYAQAEYLKESDKPLFKESIEAWRYGPVVPLVYNWLKGCGAYPVTAFDIAAPSTSNINDDISSFLSRVWNEYGKYSAGYLVSKTHEEGSPWKNMFIDGRNNVIPNEEIRKAKLQQEW